jgi:hypothetical protein
MSKSGGFIIGAAAILLGLAIITTGTSICRTSCWIDDVFRLLLPDRLDFLAIGLPSIIIGVAIVFHAHWSSRE